MYVDEQFNVAGVDKRQGHSGLRDEQPLTGDAATKAKEAALASTGGGTVLRAETDGRGGGAYEVHLVKPDGTEVEVHLDKQFNVLAVTSRGTWSDSDGGGPYG